MHVMLSQARSDEAAYLGGVRANLERYAVALAAEALPIVCPRFAISTGDEEKLVRDRALRGGVEPDALDDLPDNGELWAAVTERRKPVLHVLVKSFAGSQALRQAGCRLSGSVDEEAAAYVARRLRDVGGAPALFGLFAPGGWSAAMRQRSQAGEGARVLLSDVSPGTNGALWCDVAGGAFGWLTWLCLTPMSLDHRVAWCIARLDADRTLRRDGVLVVDEAVERLSLPRQAGERLLEAACARRDAPYRLGQTADGIRYVERKVR